MSQSELCNKHRELFFLDQTLNIETLVVCDICFKYKSGNSMNKLLQWMTNMANSLGNTDASHCL